MPEFIIAILYTQNFCFNIFSFYFPPSYLVTLLKEQHNRKVYKLGEYEKIWENF